LRRTKGWRKPEGAIVVARPSRWGNPFKVGEYYRQCWTFPPGRDYVVDEFTVADRQHAVDLFTRWIDTGWPGAVEMRSAIPDLRGRDLACWCPLDQPCHADVLLDLANRRPGDPQHAEGDELR